jgi:ATP-dependent DNA ligase
MLATSGRPRGSLDGWVVEPKADGWRVQIAVGDGGVTVWTRSGREITARVPELTNLGNIGVSTASSTAS